MLCSAGTIPNRTPTTADTATANAATRRSRRTSSSRGRFSGARASSPSTPHFAMTRPRTPPAVASTRLSVSSCVTRRARPAPSAVRTASSRRRPAPRASSSPATLAQAIKQDEPHGAQEHQQRRSHVADQRVLIRPGDGALASVGLRKFATEALRDGSEFAVGLTDRNVGMESCEALEVLHLSIRGDVAFDRNRRRRDLLRREHPKVRLVGMDERLRHHPEDGRRNAVQPDRPASDARIGPEVLAPDLLREDGNARPGRRIGLLGIGSSDECRQTKHVEERAGRFHGREPHGFGGTGEVNDLLSIAGERGEALGAAVVEIVSSRERTGGAARALPRHADDGLRIGVGQRPQQDAVDDGKNGRRAADADCQGQQRHDGEARRAA